MSYKTKNVCFRNVDKQIIFVYFKFHFENKNSNLWYYVLSKIFKTKSKQFSKNLFFVKPFLTLKSYINKILCCTATLYSFTTT